MVFMSVIDIMHCTYSCLQLLISDVYSVPVDGYSLEAGSLDTRLPTQRGGGVWYSCIQRAKDYGLHVQLA